MGSGLRGEMVQCRFGLKVVEGEYVGGDEMCVRTARANAALSMVSFYGADARVTWCCMLYCPVFGRDSIINSIMLSYGHLV